MGWQNRKTYPVRQLLSSVMRLSLMVLLMIGGIWPSWAEDPPEPTRRIERSFLFWDGDWTDGRSGVEPGKPDPNSSDGKSGLDGDFRWYHQTQDPIKFEQADQFEDNEHGGRDYSPNALFQIRKAISINGVTLKPGYYHIKLGRGHEHPMRKPFEFAPQETVSPRETPEGVHAPFSVFVIKRRGMILTTIPVERVQVHSHTPEEKDRRRRHEIFSLFKDQEEPWTYEVVVDDGKFDYVITVKETE